MHRIVGMLLFVFVCTGAAVRVAQHGAAQPAITYSPGWNLVAGPAGAHLAGAAGPLYSLQAGDSDYEQSPVGSALVACRGYWAYFPAVGSLDLGGSQVSTSCSVTPPAGSWVMAGNPGTTPAGITGATIAYSYTADAGYQATQTAAPGHGVWVAAQGLVTISTAGGSSAGALPASFFGMSVIGQQQHPAVSIGALGKPAPWGWATNEPQPGVFRWNNIDAGLAVAEAHGLDYLYDVGGTPPWAARDPSSCNAHPGAMLCTSPPANIHDWEQYITALVSRYKGRIAYYELWNEPNLPLWWTGSYADMVQLAQSLYTIVKSIDPDARVVTPAPTGPLQPLRGDTASAPDWMAAYLQAGGARFADVGAWHGYIGRQGSSSFPMPEQDPSPTCPPENCFGSIAAKTHAMRAVFDTNGMAGKPMFDTEGSWGITTNLTSDVQPAWLARWYLLQASAFATDNLQRVYWFAWGPAIAGEFWGNLQDSSGALSAAGVAANQVYAWLVGATFTAPCSGNAAGLWTCGLSLADGHQAVAVWSTAGTISYAPPPGFVRYRDLAGNNAPVGASVPVGGSPILVEH